MSKVNVHSHCSEHYSHTDYTSAFPCIAIFVRMEEPKVVLESEEMVEVCASIKPDGDRNCSSANSFFVSLWTMPDSAGEAVILFHIIS